MNLKTFKILRRFSTNSKDTFHARDIVITKRKDLLPKPDYNKPIVFGLIHTDHMLEIDYDANGWHPPRIVPYHTLDIDPRNATLQYAVECFEGMKAYQCVRDDSKVLLFRPWMNMNRLNISASRLALPNFKGEELIKCLSKLVEIDHEWVPKLRGYSLYIRPTFISMTNQIGVTPPREAKLFAFLCPAGSYFPSGLSPIRVICNENIVRSWPGGSGYAKVGANYGPTLQYYKQVKAKGYTQVLWLIEDVVTEVGVMNFFVYWINKNGEKELITCPLDGTVLPGVIRDSIITLSKSWGIQTTERHFTIHELIQASEEGRLLEAFGSGTAAIICPIKEISYNNKSIHIMKGENKLVGDLEKKLYDTLLDIQTGVMQHEWSYEIKI